MGAPKHQKVYIIYDDNGTYVGFTYDKAVKRAVLSERKGYIAGTLLEKDAKDYGFVSDNRSDYEFVSCDWYGVCLTAYEEVEMLEAFEQFKTEAIVAMENFMKDIHKLKLSKKDKLKIAPLIEWVEQAYHNYTHGIYDEMEFELDDGPYDYSAVAKYYLQNVILAK